MIKYNGGVIDCLGCKKIVKIKSLDQDCLCESCQYERDAKLDNLTDKE